MRKWPCCTLDSLHSVNNVLMSLSVVTSLLQLMLFILYILVPCSAKTDASYQHLSTACLQVLHRSQSESPPRSSTLSSKKAPIKNTRWQQPSCQTRGFTSAVHKPHFSTWEGTEEEKTDGKWCYICMITVSSVRRSQGDTEQTDQQLEECFSLTVVICNQAKQLNWSFCQQQRGERKKSSTFSGAAAYWWVTNIWNIHLTDKSLYSLKIVIMQVQNHLLTDVEDWS